MKKEKSNHLVNETSPYLLQHASNPVDWYPWEKGLQKAKEENKPLLISIGYAACHWCHVMERESFKDPETTILMNRLFVNSLDNLADGGLLLKQKTIRMFKIS